LAVRDRPIRWSAHCLLGEASPAIEAGAIEGQLDRIHHRMPREDSDESEHRLRPDSMSVIEDGATHASISPGCGAECRERMLVLTSGLANRGTDDNSIDLLLAQASCPRRAYIRIGDQSLGVVGLVPE